MKTPTPEDRDIQLQKVWKADDKFLNAMKQEANQEPMAKYAGALIQTKNIPEKDLKVLPTTVFEGFGTKDPTERLRALVASQHKFEKHNKTRSHSSEHKNKIITGGFHSVLIPIIASVVGSLAGKIFDTIKEKIQGKGIQIPNHKTMKDKQDYGLKLLKEL